MAKKLDRMNKLTLLRVIEAQNEQIGVLEKFIQEKESEIQGMRDAVQSVGTIKALIEAIAVKVGAELPKEQYKSPVENVVCEHEDNNHNLLPTDVDYAKSNPGNYSVSESTEYSGTGETGAKQACST